MRRRTTDMYNNAFLQQSVGVVLQSGQLRCRSAKLVAGSRPSWVFDIRPWESHLHHDAHSTVMMMAPHH
jgi:hypothetical protein